MAISKEEFVAMDLRISCVCFAFLFTFFMEKALRPKSTPSVKMFARLALNASSILSSFPFRLAVVEPLGADDEDPAVIGRLSSAPLLKQQPISTDPQKSKKNKDPKDGKETKGGKYPHSGWQQEWRRKRPLCWILCRGNFVDNGRKREGIPAVQVECIFGWPCLRYLDSNVPNWSNSHAIDLLCKSLVCSSCTSWVRGSLLICFAFKCVRGIGVKQWRS